MLSIVLSLQTKAIGVILFSMRRIEKTNKLVVSLSPYLKAKIEETAERYGCSQAEVLRMAFIRMLEAER